MKWTMPARGRYLALAVVSAMLAGGFTHIYLSGLNQRVPVVVAARDIPAYACLDTSLVKTVLLPPPAAHPQAARRAGEVIGLVTLVPRVAGEQLLTGSLTGGGNPGEYRAELGPGERALFLTGESVHGGWLGVEKGDMVDLLVVVHGTARAVGRGLEVLEVTRDASTSLLGARQSAPSGVFLRTTPAAAELLVLAAACGKVYVAVNGYLGVPVPTTGAWVEQLYGEGGGGGDVFWP